jgi:hypothetical protein
LPTNANLQHQVTILNIDIDIEQLTGEALAQEVLAFEEAVVDLFRSLNQSTPVTACHVSVQGVAPFSGSNQRRAINQLYRNMVFEFSYSVPFSYLESVGCQAAQQDSRQLLLEHLRARSQYYQLAYILEQSDVDVSVPVFADGTCACSCAQPSSDSSSSIVLIWILPVAVVLLLALLLIYRRNSRKQVAVVSEDDFVPIDDYTQPPAVLPDFVPPPSYDRSMPLTASKTVEDSSSDRDAPQYKPPPKYPGRRPSNEGVRMLPDYVEPPTYNQALVLRVRQGRGPIPDFEASESESSSDDYYSPPISSAARLTNPLIPHHRRAPPSFGEPPEFDLARQRPASSLSSRSSPPLDSISMNSGFDSISTRSVPEYEDPPVYFDDSPPSETTRDRSVPRPAPSYEPPPSIFDDIDASSESSFGS